MKPTHIAAVLAEIPQSGGGKKRARVLVGTLWLQGIIESHSAATLLKLTPPGGGPPIFIDVEHITVIQEA